MTLIGKKVKKLITQEANKSRLVTKCRWVVEVCNTFLKKSFKALTNFTCKNGSRTAAHIRRL